MLKSALFALILCLALPHSRASAEDGDVAGAPPELETLKANEKTLRESRKVVLNTLYDQLSAAKNAESAQIVVSAIDRLWSQSGSDTTDLIMQRALVALQDRDYDLAVELLESVSEIDPRFAAGWNQLATVYYLQDRYGAAMRGLRQVLAMDPRHFKAIEGLGIILRETGNKEAALKVMRRALEIHPFLETAKKAAEELELEVEGQEI